MKKELQFFIDHEVPQVKFVDRTFNCKHDHAMAIWNYIKEHDKGITNFHFEVAADLLNEEEIELIRVCVQDSFSWKLEFSQRINRRSKRSTVP